MTRKGDRTPHLHGLAARAPAVPALLAVLALVLIPAAALARPGGGQGYSGGGGGDGGGGGVIFLLVRLWIEFVIAYPQLGIPLTIVIAVVFVQRQRRKQREGAQHWDSRPGAAAPPLSPASHDLDQIRQLDADFSVVLFEDFAFALYARAQEARAHPQDLAALAPYLSEAARRHLASRPPVGAPVTAVVIGALRVLDLALPVLPAAGVGAGAAGAPVADRPRVAILLEYESNLTAGAAGAQSSQYVRERWRLVRDAGVRSKPPEAVKTFHCPH
ncbi:MAG TPA: hypothetical protein VOA87_01550, partial [Thermoanaerobaculia bacterium]|nr:hypothetical protein [Thermoanaerobaculia bacterium]